MISSIRVGLFTSRKCSASISIWISRSFKLVILESSFSSIWFYVCLNWLWNQKKFFSYCNKKHNCLIFLHSWSYWSMYSLLLVIFSRLLILLSNFFELFLLFIYFTFASFCSPLSKINKTKEQIIFPSLLDTLIPFTYKMMIVLIIILSWLFWEIFLKIFCYFIIFFDKKLLLLEYILQLWFKNTWNLLINLKIIKKISFLH